jgi:hypothetical protein
MISEWADIIFSDVDSEEVWKLIFSKLLSLVNSRVSPDELHEATVIPDRLLSESAWELWEAFPSIALKTSKKLIDWTLSGINSKAVLILDALSLRELSLIVKVAETKGNVLTRVDVAGSESPSTTEQFAKSLGLSSRGALRHNFKPASFQLFRGDCYTDVLNLPFEDCSVPPVPNLVIWHVWPDELIHSQNRTPERISNQILKTLEGEGFWKFINSLRQGRELVITSDHGYAISKLFSAEVINKETTESLKSIFGASRYKYLSAEFSNINLLPPVFTVVKNYLVVMGQRKWKVQGGFPHVCHGGMSLLEVIVPFLEFKAL